MSSNNNKFAILVMAHHNLSTLQLMIDLLDSAFIDFFVHIDKKCDSNINITAKYSKIFFIKRCKVNWGGYSQVKCEISLIKEAIAKQCYKYLIFVSGETLPLYPLKTIMDFYNSNCGKEFVGFDNASDYSERVKYYYLFNEIGRPKTKIGNLLIRFRNILIKVQSYLNINRIKKRKIVIKKGLAYFGITNEFASFIITNEKLIKSMTKNTLCADEIFIQTLLWNSPFKDNIYNYNNEYESANVVACWESVVGETRPGDRNFKVKDYDALIKRKECFAHKFGTQESLELYKKILKLRFSRSSD